MLPDLKHSWSVPPKSSTSFGIAPLVRRFHMHPSSIIHPFLPLVSILSGACRPSAIHVRSTSSLTAKHDEPGDEERHTHAYTGRVQVNRQGL